VDENDRTYTHVEFKQRVDLRLKNGQRFQQLQHSIIIFIIVIITTTTTTTTIIIIIITSSSRVY